MGVTASIGPPAIIAGASITKTKRYRPQLWLAWCFIIIGLGLTSTLDENTSRAASIGYQIPTGIGIGIVSSAAYFPVLAPLPPTVTARALSFFVFMRIFSQVSSCTIRSTFYDINIAYRSGALLSGEQFSRMASRRGYLILSKPCSLISTMSRMPLFHSSPISIRRLKKLLNGPLQRHWKRCGGF